MKLAERLPVFEYFIVCNNVSDTAQKLRAEKHLLIRNLSPLLWQFGSQVAYLKPLLFPTHQSPLVTLWWPSKCQSSCSTHCIMRLSVRFVRGRTAFGSCQQTRRAEKELQNCSPLGVRTKEVSGEVTPSTSFRGGVGGTFYSGLPCPYGLLICFICCGRQTRNVYCPPVFTW